MLLHPDDPAMDDAARAALRAVYVSRRALRRTRLTPRLLRGRQQEKAPRNPRKAPKTNSRLSLRRHLQATSFKNTAVPSHQFSCPRHFHREALRRLKRGVMASELSPSVASVTPLVCRLFGAMPFGYCALGGETVSSLDVSGFAIDSSAGSVDSVAPTAFEHQGHKVRRSWCPALAVVPQAGVDCRALRGSAQRCWFRRPGGGLHRW